MPKNKRCSHYRVIVLNATFNNISAEIYVFSQPLPYQVKEERPG
jgi:hypothetical protein